MANILEAYLKGGSNGKPDRGKAIVERQNDEFFTLFPHLYQLMADRKIGKLERDVSKVSIKLCPEGWISSLTEPCSGQILFTRTDNLFEVFEALEAVLAGGSADWRVDKYAKQRKAKK